MAQWHGNAVKPIELETPDFSRAPKAGEPMSDFQVITTEGKRVSKSDYIQNKALLLCMGSLGDPLTASAASGLKRLYDQFGAQLDFMTLYIGEINPSTRYPSSGGFEQKLGLARRLKARDGLPWPVAVDVRGDGLLLELGGASNAAFLMNRDGVVLFRTLHSTDESSLWEALSATCRGEEPRIKESTRKHGNLRAAAAALGKPFTVRRPALAYARLALILFGVGALGYALSQRKQQTETLT